MLTYVKGQVDGICNLSLLKPTQIHLLTRSSGNSFVFETGGPMLMQVKQTIVSLFICLSYSQSPFFCISVCLFLSVSLTLSLSLSLPLIKPLLACLGNV